MAINRNLIRHYREALQEVVLFNDVIDYLISKKVVDYHLYNTISLQAANKRMNYLLNIVAKDDRASGIFIDILYNIREERKFGKIAEIMVKERDVIRDVIVHGGFPDLPPNYVERTSQEKIIRREIKNLRAENGEVLVVHGMTGFGKSCLVNQVLQDTDFANLSNEAMFWLSMSQHENEESIVQAMASLYMDAASLSLTASVPITTSPENFQILKQSLRKLFLSPKLKNALLVLDDVKSRNVVEAFNIACRMIITTQDKDVVPPSNKIKYTQVIQGFSEKETLELFKKSLNCTILPSEANEIHNLCEGFPILVNMIGSFLQDSREEALSENKKIWNSIIEEVRRSGLPLLNNYKDDIVFIIRRNEEKLSQQYRTYFRDLAMFPKHVNIRPEILMELWGENSYTVRQIMLALANKSLVVSFYHNDLQSYVYSIHTLVYFYLEENKDETRMTELHRKLITAYYTKCNETSFKGAANYILAYFGYHLKNAKLVDRFCIFFDLRFLEKKLKSVGSVDLLRDLEIYREYITKPDPLILEKKLDDYKQFLLKYSLHLQRFPDTNIVQYALYNKKYPSVFETGLELARNNPDALYFEVQLYCGENQYYPSITLDQEVTAVCYTDCCDVVIVGTARGDVGILFLKSTRFYKKSDNHFDRVFNLQISPDKKRFLSISNDGKAKLWSYQALDLDSPLNKQESWQNPHTGTEMRVIFEMEQNDDAITTAAFANNFNDKNTRLVTGSKRGSLILWDAKTVTALMKTPVTGIQITGVIFSNNDNEIIASCDKNINIYKIGLSELIYSRQYSDYTKIIFLRKIPKTDHIIAIHNKYFNLWDEARRKTRIDFVDETDVEDQVQVAEITSDGAHLAIGTNNFIYVFDLKNYQFRQIRNDFSLSVLSLRVLQDEILFVGADNVKIEQHRLQLNAEDLPIVKQFSHFSCYWRNQMPLYPIFNENQMHLFKGNVTLSQLDLAKDISCSTFSLCGNYLIFGLKNGNLMQYNYKTKTCNLILECNEEIQMIRCYDEDADNDNNSFSSNDDDIGFMVVGTKHKIILFGINGGKEYYFEEGYFEFFCVNSEIVVIDNMGNINVLEHNMRRVYEGFQDIKITTVDLHKQSNLFAVTYEREDQNFLKIIKYNHGFKFVKDYFNVELKWKPLVSKISFNGRLLAVGSNDGSILLLNVENNEISYLWFHQEPVQSLIFAPTNEPILVSLSNEAAWWNLKSFQVSTSQNSTPDSIIQQFDTFTLGFSNWTHKKVSETTPYLLAAVNLHGKLLRFISASQKFTSFVIVDNDGNIYKLDVI